MPAIEGRRNGRTVKARPVPELLRAFIVPALAGAVVVAVGAIGIHNGLAARDDGEQQPAAACVVPDRTGLPPASGALYGVNLDLQAKSLRQYARDLGHQPAVSVSFTGFPYTAQEKAHLDAAVESLRGGGQIMLLTLEPHQGLEAVTDRAAADLATDLARFNDAGVPVIVRFAHEMNGSWYPWSQQPEQYVSAFRRIAVAVHTEAPGSAMMWAPNYGGGYPFDGGQHAARPGTAAFASLDTDSDGALTKGDDPYAPYYPGDDAADWVGMSLYHWGNTHPWGENEVPEEGKFAGQLTGTYNGTNGDETAVPDFYGTYGTGHDKPVAIPETAALHMTDSGGADEMAVKQAWWNQVFHPELNEQFPRLKMINWFEWSKTEAEVGGEVNWSVTGTDALRQAFAEAHPRWLHYAPDTPCAPAGTPNPGGS